MTLGQEHEEYDPDGSGDKGTESRNPQSRTRAALAGHLIPI
jgi:hypothetical protein